MLEGFAGQLYEKGRQRHPNMKSHALFHYTRFLFILESSEVEGVLKVGGERQNLANRLKLDIGGK